MSLTMINKGTLSEQVALWIVHLSSGDASDTDRRTFETWLAEDSARGEEYRRARRLWSGMEGAQELADMVGTPNAANGLVPARQENRGRGIFGLLPAWISDRAPVTRPLAAAAIAATFLIVAIAALVTEYGSFLRSGDVYLTEVAEIRDVKLPDGSVVTLGARSEISIDFTSDERRVVLAVGEAFFSVEKDPSRPFFVVAGDTRIRVVGTKFDVRHGAQQVKVAVLEGIVEVVHTGFIERIATSLTGDDGRDARNKVLTAGQEIISTDEGDAIVRETSAEKVAVWRSGRLVYVNEALREVVADANRYYDREIVLASHDLGDLRVTAAFRAGQIDQMIRSLSMALNLEADRSEGDRIVLRSKPDPA